MNDKIREEEALTDSAAIEAPRAVRGDGAEAAGKPKKKYFYRFVKRTFDILSSGLVLLLLSWLILLCMLIKWLEDAAHSAYELEIVERDSADAPLSGRAKRFVLPDEVKEYTDYQKQRLAVKGGLLCLWQIQPDRNRLSFDDWMRLDMEYIEKRTLWLDLKIIFKGAFMVIFDHSGE